jgi:lipopolysaccharide heptosyltransferase I
VPETALSDLHPDRIGIVRFSALGDIVHTLPAFSRIRRAWPKSRITWFVHPPGARLLAEVDGIDAIEAVTLKGIPLSDRLRGLHRIVKQYRGHLDMVIDFQGLIKSAVFARLLGAPTLGFHRADLREPSAGIFYRHHASPFTGIHVIDRNLHLLTTLGLPLEGKLDYALKVTQPDPDLPQDAEVIRLSQSATGPLILINLGGSWPSKRYDAEFWISFLGQLPKRVTPLLIWGSPLEEKLAREITARLPVKMSPFLTFSQLLWLISQSILMVSSDTLALQLADALGIPSVGLFGPTNPARNGSRLPESRAIRADVSCDYCYKRVCDRMDCRQNLSPILAARLASEVIEKHG